MLLQIILFALFLLALLLLSAGWVWLVLGWKQPGRRGRLGSLALQITVVVTCFALLRSSLLGTIVGVLLTPVALMNLEWIADFRAFAPKIALLSLPVAVLAFALCLSLPRLRAWSIAIPLVSWMIAALPAGEYVSRQAMCDTADALGFSSVLRNSFYWSLRNAPREYQFELHATLQDGSRNLGWSYREMDWYDIPERALLNIYVNGSVLTCTPHS